MQWLTGTILLLTVCAGAAAWAHPERVVSMNLCADELVLALADPGQLRSVTWLVKDPALSWSAQRAEGIPANHGTASEIIGLDPDLVVAGRYTARAAVAILQRLQVPVVELDVPPTLDGVREQIRTVAAALGQQARGRAMIEAMDARLDALGPPPAGRQPVAAVYHPNGFIAGPGSLVDNLLEHAGVANLAAERSLPSYGPLPLEVLVVARPDLLILNHADRGAPSLAHQLLRHPALAAAFTAPQTVTMPSQLWSCGTPRVVDAIERLRSAARDWHRSTVP